MSPFVPHAYEMPPAVPDCRINHVPVEGRKTATSALPSRSKSPATGISARPPHVYVALTCDPKMNHVPVDGRKTEMSAFPSPSKSPGTCRRDTIGVGAGAGAGTISTAATFQRSLVGAASAICTDIPDEGAAPA